MSLFFYKASCTGAPHALQWRTNQLNVAKFNAKEQSGPWLHAESRSVQTASHDRIIFKTTTEVRFREKVPQTASPQQKGCYETLSAINQALIRLIQLELAYVLGCVCFYNVLNKVDLC